MDFFKLTSDLLTWQILLSLRAYANIVGVNASPSPNSRTFTFGPRLEAEEVQTLLQRVRSLPGFIGSARHVQQRALRRFVQHFPNRRSDETALFNAACNQL